MTFKCVPQLTGSPSHSYLTKFILRNDDHDILHDDQTANFTQILLKEQPATVGIEFDSAVDEGWQTIQ